MSDERRPVAGGIEVRRKFVRATNGLLVASLAAVSLALGGCGDGGGVGSALQETLKDTLRQGGFENPIVSAPATYKGNFRLAPGRFLCTLGTTLDDADAALGYGGGKTTPGLPEWAYCVTDDKTAFVGISDRGFENSADAQEPGSLGFAKGAPRDIDKGDVIVNRAGTLACGSEDGRSVWCIAVKAGTGFLVDGSSGGFTRLEKK